MEPFAWVLAGLNLLMAAVYVMLGRLVAHRRPAGPGRLAAGAFALWWFALGALAAAAVANIVFATIWQWSLPGYAAYFHALMFIIVVALAALMYYMVYLFTGRHGAWLPIAAAYAAYYAAIVYWIAAARPVAVEPAGIGVTLRYANDLSDHWSAFVLGLLLIVPPLLAALAYFSLLFRVPEASQKFRIAAIGMAFIFWFGTSLAVGHLTDWGGTDAWHIGSAIVALLASALVYTAFRPPAWARRRFGLVPYGTYR